LTAEAIMAHKNIDGIKHLQQLVRIIKMSKALYQGKNIPAALDLLKQTLLKQRLCDELSRLDLQEHQPVNERK